jgi:CBS domain-containing protein
VKAEERVRLYMAPAVVSIEVDEPAGEVLRRFARHPVHHMPVVDDGKVVGMLSSADLMKLVASLPRQGHSAVDYLNRHLRIAQLMHSPAITIGPDQTVETAAALMASHGVHALPVVEFDGTLIGIVTTTDIMNAALHGPGEAPPPPAARLAALEDVARLAERYLRGGQDERLHGLLVRAVERLRELDARPGRKSQDADTNVFE